MQVCTPKQSNSPRTPPNSAITACSATRVDPRDITPDDKEIIMSTYHTVRPINLNLEESFSWNWETAVTDPGKRVEICRTRSGRSVKPPVRYEPVEAVEDDDDDDCDDCSDDKGSGVYDEELCGVSDEEDEEDDDGSYDGSFINDEESDYEDADDIEEEFEEEEDDEDEYTDTESEEDPDEKDISGDEDGDHDDQCVGDDKNMMHYYRSKKPRVHA